MVVKQDVGAVRAAARTALAAACAALAAPFAAAEPVNLDFEAPAASADTPPAWQVAGRGTDDGYDVALDAHAHGGRQSLRLAAGGGAGSVRVEQRVAASTLAAPAAGAPDTRRLRLTGFVSTAAERHEDASLWLRVSGSGGTLVADSSGGSSLDALAAARAGTAAGDRAASVAPASTREPAWRPATVELPLPTDVDEVAIGLQVRNGATAWFDDLSVEVFDAADLPAAAPAAARYLDAALDLMQAHSVRRAVIDWDALRAAAHAQARGAATAADTHTAIRYAIRALGDDHSYFSTPRWSARLREAPVANARTGRAAVDPAAEPVAEGLAYINVPGRAGGAHMAQVEYANRLQTLIRKYDASGTCGWILNLRDNSGGNLWPMLVGVGPLLGEGELGAAVYPDGERRPIWYEDGKGGFGDYVQLRVTEPRHALRDPEAPLAILIGRTTASAAEVLVAAARGRPNTRIFGTATRGASSGTRNFELSDGATLVLAVALTSDLRGDIVRGEIEPDVYIAPRRRAERGAERAEDDATLEAAVAWLRAQPACSVP